MKISMSISKGAGNTKHNKREQPFFPANIDKERINQNIVLIDSDLRELYQDEFSSAVDEYNQKQKRADRHIKDYYQKIIHSKQEKPFHEIIIQIGNKETQVDLSVTNEIYSKFLNKFITENPNIRVFGAYIHNDETTSHMHLDYVPVATGYKKGMNKRVSNDKAIKQQGYNSWFEWKENQFKLLEAISIEHNIYREVMNNTERHRTVDGYKKEMRLIEKQLNTISPKNDSHGFVSTEKMMISRKKMVSHDDYKALDTKYCAVLSKNKLLEAERDVLRALTDEYEQSLIKIKQQPLNELIDRLEETNTVLNNEITVLTERNSLLEKENITLSNEIKNKDSIIEELTMKFQEFKVVVFTSVTELFKKLNSYLYYLLPREHLDFFQETYKSDVNDIVKDIAEEINQEELKEDKLLSDPFFNYENKHDLSHEFELEIEEEYER